MKPANYVLITPARNEAAFLPGVVASVVSQTIKPVRWIIISDGSTDGTDAIGEAAAKEHSFITFIRNENRGGRSFGAKAAAFKKAFDALGQTPFDFIGNLDADMTFEPHYYERVLSEMQSNPRLGVASGVCWQKTDTGFDLLTISFNHAVGAVQFFRRECYEQIGGYRPTSVGGVDSLAELTAKMKGWEVRAFKDLPAYHHKPVDSGATRSAVRVCYRAGLTEYHIGTHPLFAVAKALRRWRENPKILGMFIRLFGYCKLWLSGVKRDAPDDLVRFLARHQMSELKRALVGKRISQ